MDLERRSRFGMRDEKNLWARIWQAGLCPASCSLGVRGKVGMCMLGGGSKKYDSRCTLKVLLRLGCGMRGESKDESSVTPGRELPF